MKQKIRVAVLYGGRSVEHEVSLQSANNVMEYLDSSLFEVIPLGIDKKGNWFLGEEVFTKSLEHKKIPKVLENTPTWFTPEWLSTPVDTDLTPMKLAKPGLQFDVVFPAVHGTFCEDGSLQGLLELSGLPYVGCGVLSSSIGMDKDVSKRLAQLAGIKVPPYLVIKRKDWSRAPDEHIKKLENELGYPLFIKPANTGSSIGISKAKTQEQLVAGIHEAFKFDVKIVVEKGLNIQELEVAVLEAIDPNEEAFVSVVGEIRPRHEFYSYDAKYIDADGALLLIPAEISPEASQQAQAISRKLFSILECEGMARVDLFLDKETQEIYFNEINTLPGFTQISMYPKLMNASGMSYSNLLTHLVYLAIQRHKIKNQLIRSYTS